MQERAIRRSVQGTADRGWMVVIAAAFVLCWASGFVVPRVFVPYAEPLTFVAWRNAGAVLVLAALSLGLGATWPRTAAEVIGLLWAGAYLQGLAVMGLYWAVYWGLPVSIAALVGGLQPVLTAMFAVVLLGEKLLARQWLASALASSASVSPCFRTLPRPRRVSC
jgi:drug/metabolite transporter (DMT)-like permease